MLDAVGKEVVNIPHKLKSITKLNVSPVHNFQDDKLKGQFQSELNEKSKSREK